MNLDQYPVVEIQWLDSMGGGKWSPLEFSEHGIRPDPESLRCRSVGWLLHQCEDCVLIVPHFTNLASTPDGNGEILLPRVAIQRITILKQEEKKMAIKKAAKKKLQKKQKPPARRKPAKTEEKDEHPEFSARYTTEDEE
jgi:hypothetical protein